jgi:uncharacterized BrkB/YihY/UPF0761 family membrane protein
MQYINSIQFTFTCKLNTPDANYKASTSREEKNTHIQTKNKSKAMLIVVVIIIIIIIIILIIIPIKQMLIAKYIHL